MSVLEQGCWTNKCFRPVSSSVYAEILLSESGFFLLWPFLVSYGFWRESEAFPFVWCAVGSPVSGWNFCQKLIVPTVVFVIICLLCSFAYLCRNKQSSVPKLWVYRNSCSNASPKGQSSPLMSRSLTFSCKKQLTLI